jgi:inosine-uridine nucleoside N-ribohydrolase
VRQDVKMPTKVILDVDTGTDDAVALMTAALSPDIELVGATSVNGNTGVGYTTENTLRVFDWIGMPEIPVFRGMGLPIVGAQPDLGMAAVIHENLLDLPACSHGATLRPEHAIDWLIETYLASDGDIVLCPVGPLTNIAMAIQKEPRMLEAIPEIVIMGGAHQMGNRTHSAEFNFFIDPEAARVVVNCGRPIRMVSLDATHRAMLSIEDAQRLRDLGTPAGEAAARFVLQRIAGYEATQPILDRPGCAPIHDALAVCAIIDPTILTTEFIPVDVEVHAELSVGRTVCDFRTRPSKSANIHFAVDANEQKFVSMLLDILGRTA